MIFAGVLSIAHTDCSDGVNHFGLLPGLEDKERNMAFFARVQQGGKVHKIAAREKFRKAHGLFHECLDGTIEIHVDFTILKEVEKKVREVGVGICLHIEKNPRKNG
jgi:hypothetical protein